MTDKQRIFLALRKIPVNVLPRSDWIRVGMALKESGFSVSDWDTWSQNDSRYKPGECQKEWNSFRGSSTPVTAGTILHLAKQFGYEQMDAALAWDDMIEDDEFDMGTVLVDEVESNSMVRNGVDDFRTYIETLFQPEDTVGYVTNDVWEEDDGRWHPGKGTYCRTAAQLLESLNRHPQDLGATVGDWKEEAGAWIRFNPLDGKGVRNDNVTRFRYALVESDNMPVHEQEKKYRELELPIAVLVHSGGKSLHAIVHIDASDYKEYQKRVRFLYQYLEENEVVIDKQNCNPSRLSRMPGVTRNGKRQYILATDIGRKNWADWMNYIEGISDDDLPEMVNLAEFRMKVPDLPEELIGGVLRKGHKMLISGSSKAGKSFLLMELCVAIAEGGKWLGFPCRKGRVLYVNFEIDSASAINRFLKIYDTLESPSLNMEDIVMWNLRGYAIPLDKFVPMLIGRIRHQHFDAVILDPIYKIITGDENKASDMGYFCNQFDRICAATGCSVIYCHHHSKGAQGQKRAMDRASGSGVFARDPDAQLDMIELNLTDEVKNRYRDAKATAWRMESSLREFQNIEPVDFWFDYPVHRVDKTGILKEMQPYGSPAAIRSENPRCKTAREAADEFRTAFDALNVDGKVSVQDMTKYLEVSDKTIYARLKKMGNDYSLRKGVIHQNHEGENITKV